MEFHSAEMCHKFLVLTVFMSSTRYSLLHSPNDIVDEFHCVAKTFECSEEKTSLITTHVYDNKWVRNLNCLFTAFFYSLIRHNV
jgi:hypothetical protein